MPVKDIVLNAVAAIFTQFNPEAAGQLLAPEYIQHNPAVPTGAAPILGFIPALKDSGIVVTTHRVIAEGDLVVLHNTYENAQLFGAETLVAFDVFRVEDGKLAEHWDNLQVPGAPNPSGRTMVDGETELRDLDKTAENKVLVSDFVRDVLQGADPVKDHRICVNRELSSAQSAGGGWAGWSGRGACGDGGGRHGDAL